MEQSLADEAVPKGRELDHHEEAIGMKRAEDPEEAAALLTTEALIREGKVKKSETISGTRSV